MILVTGATGFVGSSLVSRLGDDNRNVLACVRGQDVMFPNHIKRVQISTLSFDTDWSPALADVAVVVHSAARVHVMKDTSVDPLEEFRRVNVQGTVNLARQAAARGARRFIFISSVKVHGESSLNGKPFTADDLLAPVDPYAISKMEAEQELQKVSAETGMEVVIIRPPLVYGPKVVANFQTMMRWLVRGFPLPLGAIVSNRRSLVGLHNLIDLIVTCLDHPAAANQTFLISDGEDLSTTNLLHRMGEALGKPAKLIPVPPALLIFGAKIVNKPDIAQRLCESLQVDISKTRRLLDWAPPLSVDESLHIAAKDFLLNLQA